MTILRFAAICTLFVAAPAVAGAQELQPPPPIDPQTGQPYPQQQTTVVQPAPGQPVVIGQDQQPPPPQGATATRLDQSEQDDSGRGLEFFYVNGGLGLGYVGLETFNSDKLALAKTNSAAMSLDIGLGLRLLIVTLGPRLRTYVANGYDLWQVNGEVAAHVPISKIDVSFGLHGGYAFLGALTGDALATSASSNPSNDVRVRGFDLGLDFGVDYYVAKVFSVGGAVNGEALFLKRPALASTSDPAFGAAGGSAGIAAALGVRLGLHL